MKTIFKTYRKTIIVLSVAFMQVFAVVSQDFLKDCKVVAKKTGELTSCDYPSLGKTIDIPLSALTEELQILKLDPADDALVKNTSVTISDNYILVNGSQQIPFKLFDRKTGKFLANIGAFGQGPNEYQNIYDQQLDEANNRIYLLPWSTKKILVYDLKGKYYDPIPLCNDAPKGKFFVDTKAGTVTVSIVPFTGAKAVVWEQTTKGELLKDIAPGHIALRPDFSNETDKYIYGGNYDFSVFSFNPRTDSLYRYDVANNKLIPVFTLDFNGRKMYIHDYAELPNYFMGSLSEPKQISETTTVTQNWRFYIVDKKTLKGSFFTLKNDFLGNPETGWPIYQFNGNYYCANMDPGDLKDQLAKTLETEKNLSPAMRDKLQKLKNSITDNDNNYILYAKLRK